MLTRRAKRLIQKNIKRGAPKKNNVSPNKKVTKPRTSKRISKRKGPGRPRARAKARPQPKSLRRAKGVCKGVMKTGSTQKSEQVRTETSVVKNVTFSEATNGTC